MARKSLELSNKNVTHRLKTIVIIGSLALPMHFTYADTADANPNALNSDAYLQPVATNANSKTDSNSKDGIIALVNNTAILKSDLQSAVNATAARLKADKQNLPPSKRLQNDVLNSLILRELQLELVNRSGIQPDPNVVNQRLAQFAQSQAVSSLSELQQKLDSRRSGSYAALRAQIIEEESLKILQQSQIAKRVRITDQDIEAFLSSPEASRLEDAEYRTIHIRIPFTDDVSRISESQKDQALLIARQAKAYLETSDDAQSVLDQLSQGVAKNYPVPLQGGDMGYHAAAGLPTEITNKILPLDIGDVTEPQLASEGIDIVKLIDKRGNENMIVPQWKVRHLLVKTDDQVNEALAEQKINDLYEQLRKDANFASLASTYSDDPGSAGRGGDLDWVSEGQMVPEFEQMIKRTPVGDYSIPFKSPFGWHILKVEDQRQKDVSDTVKRNMAREALYQRLAPQAQEDWLQELKANAYIQIFD